MSKAVFFDIDGTLWDDHFVIPQSTKIGIQKLRDNGILTFLCSGRTKAFITDKNLLDLGFDGIIAGCGTYVEHNGKIVSEKLLAWDEIQKMIAFFKEHQIPAIMEGSTYLYLDEVDFEDKKYPERMKKLVGDRLLTIANQDEYQVNKFSCGLTMASHKDDLMTLEKDYEVLLHDLPVAELLPKGYSKFSGIRQICTHLNIEITDTYAFGDSVNDLDMIEHVGHGIAMGNGSNFAKEVAEYVTTSIHEDGIYNALLHYELIK